VKAFAGKPDLQCSNPTYHGIRDMAKVDLNTAVSTGILSPVVIKYCIVTVKQACRVF